MGRCSARPAATIPAKVLGFSGSSGGRAARRAGTERAIVVPMVLMPPSPSSPPVDAFPAVVGTSTGLPRHRYGQRELAEIARHLMPGVSAEPAVLERFFRRV